MNEKEYEWIHYRVPGDMQEPVRELLALGYTKSKIAKAGILHACEREGIKVASA